ncbi:MAG: c-type cytochrome [Shewanella sp.]
MRYFFSFRAWLLLSGLVLASIVTGVAAEVAPMPASAQLCASCHGQQGQGIDPVGPRLAGLSAKYIQQQIKFFQTGQRQNPIMGPMAMLVQGEAIDQVSRYFSSQTVADVSIHLRGEKASYDDPIERLVYQGDWTRIIPACVTCHGPSGVGGGLFPRLAGQQANYLKIQLLAWQTGSRKGDVDGVMGSIAAKLTVSEIDALSQYFATFK